MKKFAPIVIFLLVIFLVAGCSSSETSPSESSGTPAVDNDAAPDYSNLQLKPSQQTYQFDNPVGGSMDGSYAFEVTNTFDIPVQIDSYTVDFLDKNENTLSHFENVNLVPRIIQPGEKAYAGDIVNIETATNPGGLQEMEVGLNISKATKTVEMFDFQNLNLMESTEDGSIIITGKVMNNTSADAELVAIVVVSLGENDTLLDVTNVSSVFTLSKGSESSFETNLNNTGIKKAEVKKVTALGYDFTATN